MVPRGPMGWSHAVRREGGSAGFVLARPHEARGLAVCWQSGGFPLILRCGMVALLLGNGPLNNEWT